MFMNCDDNFSAKTNLPCCGSKNIDLDQHPEIWSIWVRIQDNVINFLSKNLVRSKKVPVMAFQKKKICQPSLSMVNLCLHSYTFYLLIYPFLPVWTRFHKTTTPTLRVGSRTESEKLIRIRNRNNYKIASCQGCVICTILQKWFYLAEKTEKAFKVPGNLLFVYKPSTASVVEPVQLCPGSGSGYRLRLPAPAPDNKIFVTQI